MHEMLPGMTQKVMLLHQYTFILLIVIIEQLLLSNRKFNWHGRFYLYFNGINNIYDFLLH